MKRINILLIVLSIIFLLIAILLTKYILKNKYYINTDLTYKSIISIKNLEKPSEAFSREYIIDTLNKQDIDLEKYLKGFHFQYQKDKLFFTFLDNLFFYTENFVGIELDDALKVSKNIYKENNISYDIEKRIIYPNLDCATFTFDGEGGISIIPKFSYLEEKYSKYVGKDIQNFIKNMVTEEKLLGEYNYYVDGDISISKKDRADLAILWRKFLNKYPKFPKKNFVTTKINIYVSDIINDTYGTFDFDDYKLIKEGKEGYEYFLKNADKTTEEYKRIKYCYDILKQNNYKANDEFRYKCILEDDLENYYF